MQPTVLDSYEYFNNLMALRVFTDACRKWQVENKSYRYDIQIETTYFDFGQNWSWTTVVATDDETNMSCQALCARDWEIIITETNINELIAMAWYFMDNLHKSYNERKKIYEKWG